MERHPEEDNDHKYEHEGSDTLFGLFFGQLYNLFSMGGGLCCLLLGGYVGMFEGLLAMETTSEKQATANPMWYEPARASM